MVSGPNAINAPSTRTSFTRAEPVIAAAAGLSDSTMATRLSRRPFRLVFLIARRTRSLEPPLGLAYPRAHPADIDAAAATASWLALSAYRCHGENVITHRPTSAGQPMSGTSASVPRNG